MPNVLSPRDLVSRPDNMDKIFCFVVAIFSLSICILNFNINLTYNIKHNTNQVCTALAS